MKTKKKILNPRTEQYVKDVRKADGTELVDPKEAARNDAIQEKNKRSQKDAETESKFGDSSDPARAKRK